MLSLKNFDVVDASVRYINAEWRDKDESPRIGSRETRRANTSFQQIKVHNARPRFEAGKINLDSNGFTLSSNRAMVTDYRDDDEVRQKYHPQMINLIKKETGADHVFVRGHLIRTEKPIDFNDGYARFVHCDYNMTRIRDMAHDLFTEQGVTPKENCLK